MSQPWFANPAGAELRERFPVTSSWTYLNTASAGPVSIEAAEAGRAVYGSLLADGDGDWPRMLEGMEAARRALATLVDCDPIELAFTRNTSHGASLVAQMLWEAGHRRAVAFTDEFPASTLPFLNRGFDLHFVASEDQLAQALEGRSVLIASQVMYRTGAVLDPVRLGQLAADRGALLVLCVTQALGALTASFRLSGAAFLLGTSHKWLCAGYGAGFLAIRRDLLGRFHWPAVGWLSQRFPDRMQNDVLDLLPEARVLEMGCASFAPVLALGAAVKLWLQAGPAAIEQRVRLLTRSLRERLCAAGFAVEELPLAALSGITIVPFVRAEEASAALMQQRIAQVPRGAGIRLAVHAFNDEEDLERAVAALIIVRERFAS